tara:strand:- start:31 stop:1035 length:1005 start_codon:yes stop_codon:yes gene_type:complete
MAFLDNSGDIILDAVLTDLGRQRMAQGNFTITKYAFGDDEINYGLYNKNHPSGSAYYDLEILQTPIMEAFVYSGAGINYGLASYTNTNLLYLPVIKQNELVTQAVRMRSSVYYLAANSDTATALGTELEVSLRYLTNNSTSTQVLLVEAGLDTTDLVADSSNRSTYIVANNLLDSTFNVYYDNRFIASVLTPTAQASFSNSSTNSPQVSLFISTATGTSQASGMNNFSVASARGIPDTVYYVSGKPNDQSAIAGPRGSCTALNFQVDSGLGSELGGTTDSKYTLYGETGVTAATLFPAGGTGYTYDYLDTNVLIQGATTNVAYYATIRIIRRAT